MPVTERNHLVTQEVRSFALSNDASQALHRDKEPFDFSRYDFYTLHRPPNAMT